MQFWVLDACSAAMHAILMFDIALSAKLCDPFTLGLAYALQPLRLETSFASFLCVPVYVCCGSKDLDGMSPRHSETWARRPLTLIGSGRVMR